jgi:NO-binding membrane sensor protein with MHYT domain
MVHVHNFSYGAINPVIAYLVSCVGCFLGLRCTTRARACRGRARARWLVLATLAIATTGIWVMHFIAMLGFTIPGQTIRYNVPITILSMLVAVLVVGGGIFIVGFGPEGTRPLLLGGLIIGIGVAAMHYIGMAAIEVPDSLSYNPLIVVVSVVIAVIAGIAALWAAVRLDTLWTTVVAALIMGVAVSGMHYTGMAALSVRPTPGASVSTTLTAGAAAFLVPLIIGICAVGFILSAVIALSPTAAEMFEEAQLQQRIGRQPHHQHRALPDDFSVQPSGTTPNGSRPATPREGAHRNGAPQDRSAQDRSAQDRFAQDRFSQDADHQPGDLFRPVARDAIPDAGADDGQVPEAIARAHRRRKPRDTPSR